MTELLLAFARSSADDDEKPAYRQFDRHPKTPVITCKKLLVSKLPYRDRYHCISVADRFYWTPLECQQETLLHRLMSGFCPLWPKAWKFSTSTHFSKVDSLRLFDATRPIGHLTLDWYSIYQDTVSFGFYTISIGLYSADPDWSKLLAQFDRRLVRWFHFAQMADRKNHHEVETCQLEKGMKTAPAVRKN